MLVDAVSRFVSLGGWAEDAGEPSMSRPGGMDCVTGDRYSGWLAARALSRAGIEAVPSISAPTRDQPRDVDHDRSRRSAKWHARERREARRDQARREAMNTGPDNQLGPDMRICAMAEWRHLGQSEAASSGSLSLQSCSLLPKLLLIGAAFAIRGWWISMQRQADGGRRQMPASTLIHCRRIIVSTCKALHR
ncbi:hypothetical protein TgHK011_006725 [Trichoderma gracile]|nr:hypothetical protein TgHK011_006725 [Trichoderma gracile]